MKGDNCKTGSSTKGSLNGHAPARLKWGEGADTTRKLDEYLRRKNLKQTYKP